MTSHILRLTTRLLVAPLLLLAIYLLWRGHNSPGGGFIAALVAGVALALRGLTDPQDRRLRFPSAATLLGVGLLLALTAVVLPLAFGAALMTSFDTHVYPFGIDVHLTTSLIFDSGVAFIVVGLLRGMLDALEHPEAGGVEEGERRHGPFGAYGIPDDDAVAEDDVSTTGEGRP